MSRDFVTFLAVGFLADVQESDMLLTLCHHPPTKGQMAFSQGEGSVLGISYRVRGVVSPSYACLPEDMYLRWDGGFSVGRTGTLLVGSG